ncbi:MAG: translation initiation factor eIF-1A [Nanoarchaeota archaeon]|nr:translation initiation factor eIF-1A [Nanoarchaeota archaeon]
MQNRPSYKGKKKNKRNTGEEPIIKVRTPRNNEVIGIVEQRLGGSRMTVRCLDGKTRNCRIPGRLKRRLWVREGDTALIQPWEFEQEKKGDVIFVYKKNQVEWLSKRGFLKGLNEFEEF